MSEEVNLPARAGLGTPKETRKVMAALAGAALLLALAVMLSFWSSLVSTSVLALVSAFLFAWLIYRQAAQRPRNSRESETRHLLEVQEAINQRLRQANVILRDSEEKLAVTLNSIGDAVIATDGEARVTRLNPVAERLTGWTQGSAIGRPVGEVFHIINKESREPGTIPVIETLAHGTVQGLANHTLLIAVDGSECDIADCCAPIRDRDGQVIGAVLVFRDVTEHKLAEEALLKAGALQSAIASSANFSSIATDARGVIQIFNVGAERMLGYAAADVIDRITPADMSDPQELVARAESLSLEFATPIAPGFEALVFKASRGIGDVYELTYIRKDGSRLPAEVSVTPLRDPRGAIIGYLLIGTDNTERKRVEAERILLDQVLQDKNAELENARFVAERANLAKSEFLSSMSHELRTPLSAILGFAQLIESGLPPPTPSQKRSVDQILKAGWYLLELINEILDLALIESGKLSLSIEPVSLTEVMYECEAMVESQAQRRGIRVAFARLQSPCFVNADRTRVKQVLINLLSNAIKYNRVGGTVSVECSPNPQGSARICVRDTGAGLSAEQLAQLFQPFNRLGQKANIEQGTGIGLVVCKRLVELMGGIIGVESSVGEGCVFWIELELTTATPNAADALEPAAFVQAQGRGDAAVRTVLYVEDNPANLMLVEDLVARRPDIRLLSARDGQRGIAMARAALPDVILMDINLPGISGVRALRILADDPATAHIPVLALSANAMPRDIEKGLAAGFFGYLTKPIKVNEFMDTLDVTLKFAQVELARVVRLRQEQA